jgi:hypothetical protein
LFPLPIAAVQSWAVVFSLVSVAWALTSYYRSVRFVRDDKEKLSWRGAVMLFCWHLMSTGKSQRSNGETALGDGLLPIIDRLQYSSDE